MIGPGVALADAVFHQTRQAGQPGDRRVDPPLEEFPLQDDLALGDVAGQVGHRVADVVGGHGQDGHLGDRALGALDASGPLVDLGQVAVKVTGIALSPRDLAAGGADLAQRFAVVGHVGQQHQHVAAQVEGQVLGQGQGGPRSEQPFDARGRGQRQEQRDIGQHAAFFEGADEVLGHVVLDAHGRKDDGELGLFPQQRGLADDLGGQPVVWHAAAGEDRQLLPADQRVHAVDGADAGLDKLPRVLAAVGVDGGPVDVPQVGRQGLGPIVDRTAQPVENTAQHVSRDRQLQRLAEEPHARGLVRQAAGALEHLDDRLVLADVKHAAQAVVALRVLDLDRLVEAHVVRLFDHHQRAVDAAGADVG